MDMVVRRWLDVVVRGWLDVGGSWLDVVVRRWLDVVVRRWLDVVGREWLDVVGSGWIIKVDRRRNMAGRMNRGWMDRNNGVLQRKRCWSGRVGDCCNGRVRD
jgi:hypothetical protein